MKITYEVDDVYVLVHDHVLKQGTPVSKIIKALKRQDHICWILEDLEGGEQ